MAVDMSSMLTQSITNGKVDDMTASANSLSSETNKTGEQNLGKMDFINLLVAEMQYQDPLEPSSNTDYVAQMAQFSQVDALNAMQQSMKNMQASGLVGQTVVLSVTNATTGNTTEVTGKVDFVQYEGSKTYLSVNGSLYNMDDLETVINSEFYEANQISEELAALVNSLPSADRVTLANYNDVNKAVVVRDALTTYQLGFIDADVLSKLSEIQAAMEQIINAEAERQREEAEKLAAQTKEAEENQEKDTTTEQTAETAAESGAVTAAEEG
ncbi:MAG: flagellar hook capping protein [Lachnospiraceae bacterium]|nr:flagellar hook capping protein [Lachnospiraceae bacterium]